MHFLTTSTVTLSCLASAVPQADSWWLGHVEPDDVVIMDIAGQALNIFLHSPVCAQEWHCKYIHSHIHSHTPMHTPQKKKEGGRNTQLTKHYAFVYWSSSFPVWSWTSVRKLVRCSSELLHVGGLQYWQKIFVDVFNKYTNIARQQCPS